jgi:hypothetical protein
MREQEQRTIAAAEEQRARELQERFDAQRAAARAQLAPVSREDWWDKATPEMIERVHETATTWKAYDPEAAQAAGKISEQVQSRYGIDVNNTGADEASVSEALPGHSRPAPKPKVSGPKERPRAPMRWWSAQQLPGPTGKTGQTEANRRGIPPNDAGSWPKAWKAKATAKS